MTIQKKNVEDNQANFGLFTQMCLALTHNLTTHSIFRYRKFNLFNEGNVRRPLAPDVVTFETDFNVTFGIFICFDILFKDPAIMLVDRGVKHFVFPTMWFSELPFLTGI